MITSVPNVAGGGAESPSAHAVGSTYLDHAATTPMRRRAIEAMTEVFATVGNASSLHGSGRAARRRVEESREAVAAVLQARPSEVVFTAGGTESNNLAVKGVFWARREAGPHRCRIIAGSTEHHAVLDAVEWLVTHEGAAVTWLPVDEAGAVRPATLRAALADHADETALVTVMWANNEVGTVNPIRELAAVAGEFDVPMHTDAVQAVGHIPVEFDIPGLSALSIAAHKFGGPQGVGALLLRRDVACTPLMHGGGHEREVRSGTVDVAGVVGMAAAFAETEAGRSDEAARVAGLRDRLVSGVLDCAPDTLVNGPHVPSSDVHSGGVPSGGDEHDYRLPAVAHVTFPGCEGDSLLMLLDAAGVECSTGSACTAGVPQASHVLVAMGMDASLARGSLRFSLGHTSTRADVDRLLEVLPGVIERARMAGMADGRGSSGHESAQQREGVR